MKRLFFFISAVILFASCESTVTVRTAAGDVVEAFGDAKVGQEVTIETRNGNVYHVMSERYETGARMIDSVEVYTMQGVVTKVN